MSGHHRLSDVQAGEKKTKMMMLSKKRLTFRQVAVLVASCLQLWLQTAHCQSLMNLPDGIENILGFVPKSSFRCERDGYFGDTDNDCKIFHLCQKQVSSNGHVEWRHWTYACGNQTMFNQLTLTCAFVDEAIPCKHASQFQYLNEVIHKPREPFLTDADVTSGLSYYTNRVMSDGARARAFEDSHLMAQLGGPSLPEQFQNNIQANNLQFQPDINQLVVQSNNLRLLNSRQQLGPQADVEADNSASNNVNSVELPLAAAFEALARPQSGQQDLVVVGRQIPSNQQVNERQNNFGLASQSFFASTGGDKLFSGSLQSDPVGSTQASGQPESNTQSAGSFSFSLSTDHQPGASSSSLFSSSQTPFLGPTASLAPPALTTQPTTAASLTTVDSPVVSNQPPTTTTTGQPRTTTLRQQILTSTTQQVAPTTTTLASITSTEPRQTSPTVRANRQPTFKQQRSSQRLNSMEHGFHSGAFHSTRLSASQPKPQDTPLLMRRQVAASKPAPRVAPSPAERPRRQIAAGGQQAGAASSLADASGGFWRQALYSQLLAPKFESLLTRRRV